ncbi:lipid A biosynthesis lauroyl acyltransferase [Salmonella enterica subsp. arizonae]|uniref:Lipid A biosynthesis lauroyl acyltransferase n=1 Tax=Salmonella enterica subsp. arizonae TaxID=59203 RepID=A0A447R644_SALER|nr:lipid A biosynthesis lauroyl acyltransferase [Salmonella enterica subsp. arizonae]
METGMAWFWPDRRVTRWMEASGLEYIREVKAQGSGSFW